MAQSQLRKDLIQLRFKAHLPEKSFIPQKRLYRLLNRERILAVVRAVQEVPGYRVDDVVDIIAKGGAKVLAILSLLKGEEGQILKFISHDQFQRSSLDSKLPLSVAALSDIVPDIAAEFYSAQWEVAAPVFSTGVVHRELHDFTRLPFVRDESLGDGGFGDIYEIELHPDHQVIDFVPKEDHLRAVRKEFKRSDEAYGYELELRNLNILNELSHPNIVELLGSYTYRGKHNLLFRLAPKGNLATLFENDRPQAFASDQSIYRALSQLSSAIETVHNFTSKSLDLACIGCHHDLKPRNILVQENKFILADFGISRIKDASESSKEEFQIGAGHYLAPECEDFENNFQKHTIGRSSDIWSFGCIIAEVLTYMIKGKGAVEEFRRARALKFGSFKTYTFHAGSSDSHSGVLKWLSGLEDEGITADRLCVELVRDMLAIDPNNRPNAKQVTSKLRYISLTAQMQATDKIFREMSLKIDSVEADLETRRYNAWKDTLGNITIQERPWYTAADALLDFDDFFECLIKIDEEIRRILFRFQTAFRPLFNGLRDCVNTLISHLPLDSREQIQTRVEVGLIESEDLNELNSVQERYEQAAVGERIGMLATIKLMSILALERTKTTRPDLHLDFKTINISTSGDRPLIDHDIGTIDSDQRNVKCKIVIEWRRYATYWHGPVSSEMLARIEANAELLSPSNKPPNVLSLDCIGFFHQPLRHAFGIVYRFPGQQNATFELSPLTLASIIRKTADTRARPSLDDRFNLAHQLASSVLEFHKVGWMHKAICPHNIAFFPGKRAHPLDWIKEPYIIGFNHSRQNEPKAFTEGPSVYNPAAKYQHYEYHGERAYLQAFDYYSLGLVLLEIGLWKLLEDQTAGWRYADGKEMKKMLFEKRVALLAHHMGTQYCSAVKACLSVELVTETGNMSQLEFATQVVQPLRLCSLYGRTAS